MDSLILIKIGGIYHIGFALFHIMFWKIFKWKEDLSGLKRVNSAIMQVLNLCLTFCFIFFAYISLFHTEELILSAIGRSILVFIAIFWLMRAIEQFIFFNYKRAASIVIIVLCLLGFCLYIYPLFFM